MMSAVTSHRKNAAVRKAAPQNQRLIVETTTRSLSTKGRVMSDAFEEMTRSVSTRLRCSPQWALETAGRRSPGPEPIRTGCCRWCWT